MITTPDVGKTYLVERHGDTVLALVKATTNFQARVEIDGEEDLIWIPLSSIIGEPVIHDNTQDAEEQPLLALLVNAQALIEQAIMQVITKDDEGPTASELDGTADDDPESHGGYRGRRRINRVRISC